MNQSNMNSSYTTIVDTYTDLQYEINGSVCTLYKPVDETTRVVVQHLSMDKVDTWKYLLEMFEDDVDVELHILTACENNWLDVVKYLIEEHEVYAGGAMFEFSVRS